MATCKDCFHEKVCFTLIKSGLPYLDNDKLPAEAFCLTFRNKADVVEKKDCEECIHFGKHATQYPCSHCRNCYTDKFQQNDKKERGNE